MISDLNPIAPSPSEREFYLDYERERRLRLARLLAPALGLLSFLFFVSIVVVPQDRPLALYLILVIDMGVYIAATAAAWRNAVTLATGNILVGLLIGLGGFIYTVWVNDSLSSSSTIVALIPADIIIAVASLLGELWMIPVVTGVTSIGTLVLGIHGAHVAAENAPNFVLAVPTMVIEQWGLTFVLFIAARTYRQTLREIGDIRVAYERARQLDDLKDQFISSVNHELRNPVMALQGYVEILKLKHRTMPEDRREEMLDRATRAGDRLVYLLMSILDARRLDQGADDFTPELVNVREAINAALALIDPREGGLGEREVRVSVPATMGIWGEGVRLQQILSNLISNAAKYSEEGLPIEIKARLVIDAPAQVARWWHGPKPEHHMVEISVRDFGLGVPLDQAPLLFQRFVRLPRDLASRTIGNGLGLHLCRVYAEAMKGSIAVDSSGVEGEGSVFRVRLPLPPHINSMLPFIPEPELATTGKRPKDHILPESGVPETISSKAISPETVSNE